MTYTVQPETKMLNKQGFVQVLKTVLPPTVFFLDLLVDDIKLHLLSLISQLKRFVLTFHSIPNLEELMNALAFKAA